jgi:NTE family protein
MMFSNWYGIIHGTFRLAFVVLATMLLVGCGTTLTSLVHTPPSPPPVKIPKKVDVALVLGAGGSRALTHVGLLEVLEEEGVPIDVIVGSSAGSIVGAMYADYPNAIALKESLINLKQKDLLDLDRKKVFLMPLQLTGPVQGVALEKFLIKVLCAKTFDELKIHFVAVATNVNDNQLVMLRSGPIVPAVHASSALPPVFTPVKLYNQMLVDGGVIAPVPVQVAKLYKPKLLIAVDISTPPPQERLTNALELAWRSLHISFYELSRMQTKHADIFIHPNLEGYGTFDDKFNMQLYEKGKATARAAMPSIKKALARRGIKLHPKRLKKYYRKRSRHVIF